jgi:hypothetical protein
VTRIVGKFMRLETRHESRIRAVTADKFLEAMKVVRPPADRVIEALSAHLVAKRHTITAGQLASIVGYENHGGINLGYGLLAAKIGRNLRPKIAGVTPRLSLLLELNRANARDHWMLTMRPQFAKALKQSGWI